MLLEKTHREIKKPQMGIRYLAEYMNGSERSRRTTLRNCKYQKIARVIQHKEAKLTIAKHLKDGTASEETLKAEADYIRNRLSSSDFEEELFTHNADYISRFAQVVDKVELPADEILNPGPTLDATVEGVRVTASLDFKLRRVTRTNKVRIGAGMLRYKKGTPLPPTLGEWQSALIFGILSLPGMIEEGADPEVGLCATVDAYSGAIHVAPTNAVTCFKNAEAACTTIANAWDNVEPPKGAIF